MSREKFYIETFGCQMNKSDSDLISQSLVEAGFTATENIDEAKIAVYNTCSVRQHAEDRAIAKVQTNSHFIRKNKGITVIAGCMAQRIGDQLVKDKIADLIIGPYESPKMGTLVLQHLQHRNKTIHISQLRDDFEDRINFSVPENRNDNPWHDWISITHGCENFCSYCIVPYVRGKLISFPSTDIIKYMKVLAAKGIKEITLLGQNVNQYGTDSGDLSFAQLLEEAAQFKEFVRINFLTSHPKDFTDDIINVIRDNENISRSIHLPLQSGSDRILSLMNRNYTIKDYMTIVEKLTSKLKTYALSTDLIVGFPTETEEEYLETLEAVKKIQFDDAFTYAYSPREGTPAFKMKENISISEKKERLNRLIEEQRAGSTLKLKARIDAIEETIVERISKRSENKVLGKTFLNHPVVIPGTKDDIGKKIKIRIHGIKGSTLQGTRIA